MMGGEKLWRVCRRVGSTTGWVELRDRAKADELVSSMNQLHGEGSHWVEAVTDPPPVTTCWAELPRITVDGVTLTEAQVMTIHVAVQGLVRSLRAEGLGVDEHGKTMTELYLARCAEINALLVPG